MRFLDGSDKPRHLTATEEKDTEEVFDRAKYGADWVRVRLPTARAFRNVIRWLTFRGAYAEAPVDLGALVALARLDTCGLGMPDTDPGKVGPRDSLGSAIFLFPDLTKPVRGALDGLSAYLESRMALSGHELHDDPVKDFARFDPRFFMRLVAIKQPRLVDPERDLWRRDQAKARGLQLDLILTGMTRRTWLTGKEEDSRSFDVEKQKDLIDVVLDHEQPADFTSQADVIPVFRDLASPAQELLDPAVNERSWRPIRRVGFRVIGTNDSQVSQLGLRFEATFPEFTAQAGAPMLAEPLFKRIGPGRYRAKEAFGVRQEQRVGTSRRRAQLLVAFYTQ